MLMTRVPYAKGDSRFVALRMRRADEALPDLRLPYINRPVQPCFGEFQITA